MSKFAVLLLAAGRSTRFGDAFYKKPFVPLAGRAVWLHAMERFADRDDVAQQIVVVAPDDAEEFQRKYGANLAFSGFEMAIGGAERCESGAAGLARVREDIPFVAVHDAARPCVTPDEVSRVFDAARADGAAILATPVAATLKRVDSSGEALCVAETVSRDKLWEAQTPQAFRADLLRRAYAHAGGERTTDDAQLVERLGGRVTVVPGSPTNLKITTRADLGLAEAILAARPRPKPEGSTHPFQDDDLWR